ncbi:hypothetical protein [Zavarzinia sp.]|uniref:hypothetical protein n=1 Tax=Zavarzinia sp. TaxID=2027920 RepID=UPI0035653868
MSMSSTFRFALGGFRFEGRMEPHALDLSADLGPLPFSAEDREGRARWRTVLDAADPRAADRHVLGGDGHVHFESGTALDAPLDRTALFQALTIVMLGLRNRVTTAPQVRPVKRFRAERES